MALKGLSKKPDTEKEGDISSQKAIDRQVSRVRSDEETLTSSINTHNQQLGIACDF